MKICHILLAGQFCKSFIEFVNYNFDSNAHEFLVYGEKNGKIQNTYLKNTNVRYIHNIEEYLKISKNLQKLQSYDKILIHGLFESAIINHWWNKKELYEKTYIYLWGGDFYPESLNDSFCMFWKRRFLLQRVKGIINILPDENRIVKKLYRTKARLFHAIYWGDDCYDNLMRPYKKQQNNECVKIQVGNSASEENNHIEILKLLEKYKNEKIEIYVPLSYGNKIYADQVISYGKRTFGNKFIPITEFMELNEYFDFMYGMDVAILGMQRQQALGNTMAHIMFGNIVYLNRKSVVAHYCRKCMKCHIRKMQNIEKLSIGEFSYMNDAERKDNHHKASRYGEKEKYIQKWESIFRD